MPRMMVTTYQLCCSITIGAIRVEKTDSPKALITTAAGLIVAIPVQTAHNYFVSRIDKFVIDIEESGAELVDALATYSRQWETFLSTLKPPSTPIAR